MACESGSKPGGVVSLVLGHTMVVAIVTSALKVKIEAHAMSMKRRCGHRSGREECYGLTPWLCGRHAICVTCDHRPVSITSCKVIPEQVHYF